MTLETQNIVGGMVCKNCIHNSIESQLQFCFANYKANMCNLMHILL